MSAIVRLQGVKRFYGEPPVAACRGVELQVDEGEFVAIVGPSGSGKSTLLNLIGTLDRPSEGTVEIARAVVSDPPLLLADEPTGNLDSASDESIVSLLHDLHAEGTSIIVITHDNELAARLPRRVMIRDGRIVTDSADERAASRAPPDSPSAPNSSPPTSSGSPRPASARGPPARSSPPSASRSASPR